MIVQKLHMDKEMVRYILTTNLNMKKRVCQIGSKESANFQPENIYQHFTLTRSCRVFFFPQN
jgi:hypothetical protein